MLTLSETFDRLESDVPLPRPLYHYTTWKGFQGIAESGQFWATSYNTTNDAPELKAADTAILGIAKELNNNCPVEFLRHVLKAFRSQYELQPLAARKDQIFLSCFSLARDSSSQWNLYGDKGEGVCVTL